MTDDDIKAAIKTIEIHHEHGWWIADMPDIGVVTQAKTLPELGVEIERIVVAHFAVNAEVGTDPFRCKVPSTRDDVERLGEKIKWLDRVVEAARALRPFLVEGPDRNDDHQEAVDNFRATVDSLCASATTNEGK